MNLWDLLKSLNTKEALDKQQQSYRQQLNTDAEENEMEKAWQAPAEMPTIDLRPFRGNK